MKKTMLVLVALCFCTSVGWAREVVCRLSVRAPHEEMRDEKSDQANLTKEMKDGLELKSNGFTLNVTYADYKISHVGQKAEPHEPHTVEMTITSPFGVKAHTMGDVTVNPAFVSLEVGGKTANASCK